MITDATRTAVAEIVKELPEEVRLPLKGTSIYHLNPKYIDGPLSDLVQGFAAELVATLINAGSERDAVMESSTLHDAIVEELRAWIPADHELDPS
jgi:hypothetical protein